MRHARTVFFRALQDAARRAGAEYERACARAWAEAERAGRNPAEAVQAVDVPVFHDASLVAAFSEGRAGYYATLGSV